MVSEHTCAWPRAAVRLRVYRNGDIRTAYQLHLLFDKHFDQQSELVDAIAERIQLLGGVSLAMAPDDELQVWFIAEHVVDMPLVHAEPSRQVGR